jgi:hypothetical protein
VSVAQPGRHSLNMKPSGKQLGAANAPLPKELAYLGYNCFLISQDPSQLSLVAST